MSDLVLCNPLIWVSISTYSDDGTTKVPISEKIGVRVQRSTSEIWNTPSKISEFFDVLRAFPDAFYFRKSMYRVKEKVLMDYESIKLKLKLHSSQDLTESRP